MGVRGNMGRIALAIGMLLVCSGPVSAKSKQTCFKIGTNEYLLIGKVPSRNKCNSVYEADSFGIFSGLLANGAACLSGDGSTLLLTLSDGYFSAPETVQGSLATSNDSGTCEDCVGSSLLLEHLCSSLLFGADDNRRRS
jgi:hypothetical protein